MAKLSSTFVNGPDRSFAFDFLPEKSKVSDQDVTVFEDIPRIGKASKKKKKKKSAAPPAVTEASVVTVGKIEASFPSSNEQSESLEKETTLKPNLDESITRVEATVGEATPEPCQEKKKNNKKKGKKKANSPPQSNLEPPKPSSPTKALAQKILSKKESPSVTKTTTSSEGQNSSKIIPSGPSVLSYRDPELTEEERNKRKYGTGLNLSSGLSIGRSESSTHSGGKHKRSITSWAPPPPGFEDVILPSRTPLVETSTADIAVSLDSLTLDPSSTSRPAEIKPSGWSPFSFGFQL